MSQAGPRVDRKLAHALARAARVLAGAAAVLAVFAIYYAARGAMPDLVYDLFVWPFQQYGLGQGHLTYGAGLDEWLKAHRAFHAPWRWPGTALWATHALPWAAVPAAAVAAAKSLRRLVRRDGEHRFALAAAVSVACVSPLLAGCARQDLTHAAFLACFGVLALAAACAPGRAGPSPWTRRAAGALFGAAGLLAVAAYAHKVEASWKRSRALGGWEAQVLGLPSSAWLVSTAPPEARVAVGVPHAGFRYLTLRRAAVGYTLVPVNSLDYFSTAQWRRFADEIATRRPAALLLSDGQWLRLVRERPDLATTYRNLGGGRFVPRDTAPSAAAPPTGATGGGGP
ncbi:MAG TPA: hypothetical protein VG389_15845 [Myxococcota bacterium]|nr:hypothetical protein [Myxococcota bacterium]